MRSTEKGFTLVEMIISLSLMTLTMATLVSLFSGGMRIWQRSECGARHEQSMYVSFDKIRRDLHHIQPFQFIPFRGSHDTIEFPVMLDTREYKNPVLEPGRQIFFFDAKKRVLCENEELFRGMKRSRGARACKVVMEGIDKVKFSYLSYNSKSDSFAWSSQWSGPSFPVSIKMELEYEDLCREQNSKKQFTIAIPIGPIR